MQVPTGPVPSWALAVHVRCRKRHREAEILAGRPASPSLLPSERQHPQPATVLLLMLLCGRQPPLLGIQLKRRLSLVEAGVGGDWLASWQLHKEGSCLLCPE